MEWPSRRKNILLLGLLYLSVVALQTKRVQKKEMLWLLSFPAAVCDDGRPTHGLLDVGC